MRDLPTIHPRKGSGSKYSTKIKQVVLGGRHFDADTFTSAFPEYIDADMDITLVDRENVLSASYQVENTYFIKTVTERHLKAHRLLTWWRNTVFTMTRLPAPFTSYETPEEMVEYEHGVMQDTYHDGGAMAQPYTATKLPESSAAALLFDYVPNAGKLKEEKKSLKAFKHIVHTLETMHGNGHIHTSLPFHVLQSVPSGKPYISDPIGRVADTEQAQLLGIGFDLATLLTRYTPYVGAVPALNVVTDYYSDVELVAAYKTTAPVQVTVPGTPNWAIRQLRASIDEFVDADALDTYQEIVTDDPAHSNESETDLELAADTISETPDPPRSSNEPDSAGNDSEVDDRSMTTDDGAGRKGTDQTSQFTIRRFLKAAFSRQSPNRTDHETDVGMQTERTRVTGESQKHGQSPGVENDADQVTSGVRLDVDSRVHEPVDDDDIYLGEYKKSE